jgi:hypothetical protein
MATNDHAVSIGGTSAMLGELVIRSVSLATLVAVASLMAAALFSF